MKKMSNLIIPLLLITPLLFGALAFAFYKKATLFGLLFAALFLTLCIFLFYGVANNAIEAYSFGSYAPPLGISYEALPFGTLVLLLSAFILFVVFIYSAFYLNAAQKALFYPLSIFLSLGFVIIYLSRDIFNIYIGLEIIGLSAVGLSALKKCEQSIHAALIYLFATLVASGLYLLGVAIIYAKYSLLDISLLAPLIEDDFTTLVAFMLICSALLIKTALFPFSFWLPNAHANALTPVSALLSSVVIKTTFYLLYLFGTTLFVFATTLLTLLGVLGVVAIFYGGIKALMSDDFKLLIAYSSVSQVGYLVVLFAFSHTEVFTEAYYAMVFALLSHALAKSGLFLASGVLIYKAKSRSLRELQGYATFAPVGVFAIGLSALSLIGLPPSLGFISKWYYLQSSFESGMWFYFGAFMLGGVLSALYLFKLLVLFLQKPLKEQEENAQDSTRFLEWSAFLLSFLAVFLGVFTTSIISFLG